MFKMIAKIVRWSFIGFNALMFLWVASGLFTSTSNDAEAIGKGIGVFMLLFLWAIGDIILGILFFFTRSKK